MSRLNSSDEQAYNALLKHSGLPVIRKPEWINVGFGKKFHADFTFLGDHILISRPSGYATLHDAQASFHLGYDIIRQCAPAQNAPYIIIEDYSKLEGVSIDARKFFINDHRQREHVMAMLFCHTSALFNLSIKLGKKIYAFSHDIIIAKDLSAAIDQAKSILSANDLFVPFTAKGPEPAGDSPKIDNRNGWSMDLKGFAIRFERINDNIMHPIPTGFIEAAHIGPIFELQEKVFNDMGFTDGEYYLVVNQKALTGATLNARKKFVIALRSWHQRHPLKKLIFYNTNWLMRAAINISKGSAPHDVFVANDFDEALRLVSQFETQPLGKQLFSATPESQPTNISDTYRQYADELLQILSEVNWESRGPDEIIQKIDPSHPFSQVIEAISLIKMDMDQILSEQKKVEKELFNSREKYKNILNNIEEGYYENDLAGNLTFFNDSLCHILGYSRTELEGINYRVISDQEYLTEVYETFNQVYKTGTPTKALDWKLTRKDGSSRYIEMSVSCIYDEQNVPCGFRGIVRDITPRIMAEKEKALLETKLRHAQKMEAIGTLAGGVAHDLNNILSGLVSYPDLLLMKLPDNSPIRKPIQTIKKSGEKAAAIVSDLLTLARKGLPDRTPANINMLVEDYLKSPEHNTLMAHHPNTNIVSHPGNQLLNISASSVHISKIIMNLITNAAEAMPDGGTIHIETLNLYMDAPLPGYQKINEGDYVKLAVKDEGIGMTDEEQERIFEPFYTKKSMGQSGSGLGMAMVWGAVHDHDGYIQVSSKPASGSTISVYFPAVRTALINEIPPTPLTKLLGNNETILVVDDIFEQRELAVQILTELNYQAISVPSGEKAVEYIKNNAAADLMIIDMIMEPGMDGLDTYKKVISINPDQKAVIATGYSTSDRIAKAQALGAGACLKKPYVIESLAKAVREALDQ